MKKIDAFQINKLDNNKKVLVYGAGIGGYLTCKALCDSGIDVWAVCDRVVEGDILGIPIITPQEIVLEQQFQVLVTATRAFDSIMLSVDLLENVEVFEVSDFIHNTHFDFASLPYDKIAVEDFLKKYIYYVNAYISQDKIELPTLDIMLSQICNLKCKDCSVMVPYVKDKRAFDVNKIIANVEKVKELVEHVVEVVLVGGEPFLYKDLAQLLFYLQELEFIEEISIVTNGTIIPKKELLSALRQSKVRIRISEYNLECQKIDELRRFCEENEIRYFVQELEIWKDMGRPIRKNYTNEVQKNIFRDCEFSKSQCIVDGKIFRCIHAGAMHNMRICDAEEGKDYIDLEKDQDVNARRHKLKQYLFEIESISYCGFCNGVSANVKGIPPAIQI